MMFSDRFLWLIKNHNILVYHQSQHLIGLTKKIIITPSMPLTTKIHGQVFTKLRTLQPIWHPTGNMLNLLECNMWSIASNYIHFRYLWIWNRVYSQIKYHYFHDNPLPYIIIFTENSNDGTWHFLCIEPFAWKKHQLFEGQKK